MFKRGNWVNKKNVLAFFGVIGVVASIFGIIDFITGKSLPDLVQEFGKSETIDTDSRMVSPKDDMVMMYVPSGEFVMGSKDTDGDLILDGFLASRDDEKPQHTVLLDAFWIDRTEVTNAQYARCVAQGACKEPNNKSSFTRDFYFDNPEFSEYPVIFVSWQDAVTYCTWAGRRLATEAEWEKAARGLDTAHIYPWGYATPNCKLANIVDPSAWKHCVGDTSAVGSYPDGASPYDVLDMAGNVSEWVNDVYQSDYYSVSVYANPSGPSSGNVMVTRGGSWGPDWYSVRVAHRNPHSNDFGTPLIGIRCAANAEN